MLGWVLALNVVLLVAELIVGWSTGSLAVLSDAGHMLGDVGALLIALGAAWLARRPARPDQTFGMRRAEVLGALINGGTMVVVVLLILIEAVERLVHGSPEVPGWPVLVIGVIGLAVNLGSAWALYRSDKEDLNIRGALIHMMGDALGSVAAIVAAGFLLAGIHKADAVASLLVAVIVTWSTLRLLSATLRVLLQFAPPGLSVQAVRAALLSLEDVAEVHALHIWSLDGRQTVLSAHLVARSPEFATRLTDQAAAMLKARFDIRHCTVQVETDRPCGAPDLGMQAPAAAPEPEPEAGHGHDHGHGHGHG